MYFHNLSFQKQKTNTHTHVRISTVGLWQQGTHSVCSKNPPFSYSALKIHLTYSRRHGNATQTLKIFINKPGNLKKKRDLIQFICIHTLVQNHIFLILQWRTHRVLFPVAFQTSSLIKMSNTFVGYIRMHRMCIDMSKKKINTLKNEYKGAIKNRDRIMNPYGSPEDWLSYFSVLRLPSTGPPFSVAWKMTLPARRHNIMFLHLHFNTAVTPDFTVGVDANL